MNKPLKAFMEAKSSEMLDELLQEETTPEAEAAEPVVIGDQPQIDKTLNRLTEVRLDVPVEDGVPYYNAAINRFLKQVFTDDQFKLNYENRENEPWRSVGSPKLIAGSTYYRAITYRGFEFTYTRDYDAVQTVINFIPADIIQLGGTVPKEFLP